MSATRDPVDRVFGDHEADAMFEAIGNALAILGAAGSVSGGFLQELREERALLQREVKDAWRAKTGDKHS